MADDEQFQRTAALIEARGQAAMTREEQKKTKRSLDKLGLPSFAQQLAATGCRPLTRTAPTILQLNIGLYCNQACSHCHVESSPLRTEVMSREVAEQCLGLLDATPTVTTLDLTGGAPELCPEFRYLVTEARKRNIDVIDRCNLTVLLEPGQEDLVEFLAKNQVRVAASLPCYSSDNVDNQRGRGVFERSIEGLQRLNAAGYGRPESPHLILDLVYNPGGPFLAPAQSALEPAYKEELGSLYGITFTQLWCLNNMPIKRYHDWLSRRGHLDEYMALLLEAFNPKATDGVMCLSTVSVGWDGRVYDCDFNQQLDISSTRMEGGKTVFDLESLDQLTGDSVAVADHCYGCTAGAGSSCQGQT